MFIDRDRVTGVVNQATQRSVVELIAPAGESPSDAAGNAEAPHRVEDPDERDAHQPGSFKNQAVFSGHGWCFAVLHFSEPWGVFGSLVTSEDFFRGHVRRVNKPAFGYHSGETAGGEGAAAVPEKADAIVLGVVVLGDEAVGICDVVFEAVTEGSTGEAAPYAAACAHSGVVVDSLRRRETGFRGQAFPELRDVGAIFAVSPCAIEQDRDVHDCSLKS
ncbi:hypothetical protein [Nesterenkonia pannonica]|uniref:hypothetical protein n=1 Tax=Nesterenkonia pannonica TaxID=1548602 RepID=UPI002164BF19|nr:hypothetical protein [Nesterenkonia pannonica]